MFASSLLPSVGEIGAWATPGEPIRLSNGCRGLLGTASQPAQHAEPRRTKERMMPPSLRIRITTPAWANSLLVLFVSLALGAAMLGLPGAFAAPARPDRPNII